MKHKLISICFFLTAFVLGYLAWTGAVNVIVIGVCLGVYVAITALGSSKIGLNYFLTSQSTIKENNQVLLTFDDGPDETYTPLILDQLKENNIKAVFFLIGKKAEANPFLVRRIVNEGHTIGNHSYSHHNLLPLFSTDKLFEDIDQCTQILFSISGLTTQLFRPPFGVTTPRYASSMKKTGMFSVGWSLRSMDTVCTDAKQLLNKIDRNVKGNDIILLHDTQRVTSDAISDIIALIRNKNLKFALPASCFENIYENH